MYPILLNLQNKKCVVVGGGSVAERKVIGLIEVDADITLISPTVTKKLEELVSSKKIIHLQRDFNVGDLDSSYLVIGATNDTATNDLIYREANEKGVLVNIVDVPQKCSFFVPSSIKRGNLTIAISTDGKCPALSKHLREQFEEQIGPEFKPYLNMLSNFRSMVKKSYPNSPSRSNEAYERVFKSDVLQLIADGNEQMAEKRIAECI